MTMDYYNDAIVIKHKPPSCPSTLPSHKLHLSAWLISQPLYITDTGENYRVLLYISDTSDCLITSKTVVGKCDGEIDSLISYTYSQIKIVFMLLIRLILSKISSLTQAGWWDLIPWGNYSVKMMHCLQV